MKNYRKVHSEIDDARRRVGRQPSGVHLLPASKTVSVDALVESWLGLAAAGCVGLAENRVQEAVAKTEAFRDAFGDKAPHMVIISPLQTNKADHLVSYADESQAPDHPKVTGALQCCLVDSERILDALIQVNASHELQKSGLAPSHAAEFVCMLGPDGEYPSLRLRGFMTIAAQSDPNAHETFTELRELRNSLLGDLPEGVNLDELSMGMSGDYHEAIAERAITVCVRRAILGERSYQKQRPRNRGNLIVMSSDVSPCFHRCFLPGIAAIVAGAPVAACIPKSEIEKVDAVDIPVGSGVMIGNYVVTQPEEDKFATLSSSCPHQNGRIFEVSNGVVICPNHNSQLDIATGEVAAGPLRKPAGQAPLSVEGTELTVSRKQALEAD